MIGIIGGTGLYHLSGVDLQTFGDTQTPYGPASAALQRGELNGQPLLFLARHGSSHRIAPHKINYRANLWLLKSAGVERIIAVNAVGSIDAEMTTGSLVIPHQLVDYSWGRASSFFDGEQQALQHIDFTHPFSDKLRQALIAAARLIGQEIIDAAVYGVTQGPRLETAAEINRLERDGCDIVGMTAMPEAALARELAIDYASLCLVVNPAAGRSPYTISLDDIQLVVDSGMIKVESLIRAMIQVEGSSE